VHLQSMSSEPLHALGGWIGVPTPEHSLATSRATLTLGLPPGVHPVAVVGGDHPWLAFATRDALAVVASIALALLGLRGRLRRGLGIVALGGLWFASHFLWGMLVLGGVSILIAWVSARLLPRGLRMAAWGATGLAAFVVGMTAMTMGGGSSTSTPPPQKPVAVAEPVSTSAPNEQADLDKTEVAKDDSNGWVDAPMRAKQAMQAIGQMNARTVLSGGIMQGVAPVALPLPTYDRSVVITRELVTPDRPLTLGLVYVTSLGLVPFAVLWLACVAWLARLHGAHLARLVRALRERLARQADPDPAPAAPLAPPPVVA
jgi:hypothetical protein